MLVDLPLGELQTYRPDVPEPHDFDEFWTGQLDAVAELDPAAAFDPVPTPIRTVDVLDVTFAGHGGNPVKGWLLLPPDVAGDAPVIVEFVGYGGGRGDPLDWLAWSSAGFPHLGAC